MPADQVYFETLPAKPDAQLQSVTDFRAMLEQGCDIFFREFSTTAGWEEMFREPRLAYLDGLNPWDAEVNFVSTRPVLTTLEGCILAVAHDSAIF